jgi:imidazoleglycerol-phosphate dehydratase/histidinol-phosphatase
MKRKILFIDRDGTLIHEPPDEQIDSYAKLALVDGVIPALLRLRDAGYRFVMVTNQDGLGTAGFPREAFEGPQALLLQILGSQGIRFDAIHIDPHYARDNAPTRKPGIGMMLDYLRAGDMDMQASAVIGDRATDIEFAHNLGVRGLRLGSGHLSWAEIAHELASAPRRARVTRHTNETRIAVEVDLDREAPAQVRTGLGFFDHMLDQLGRHGAFALRLECAGDVHVDEHHTVEDCALALGEALDRALGERRGLARYGFVLPMDEARAEALIDLSGRAHCEFEGAFGRERVGELPTELVSHFFRSLAQTLRATVHVRVRGDNAHHMVEACFKACARALRMALARQGEGVPSTKGVL